MLNFELKSIAKIIGNQKLKYGLYARILTGSDGYVYQLISENKNKNLLKTEQIKKKGDRIFSVKELKNKEGAKNDKLSKL